MSPPVGPGKPLSADAMRALIRDVPDFPTPGILFRDITPLLASPEGLRSAVAAMAEPWRASPPAKVFGIEARGFLFGAALACELGAGFVPVRKKGKLPRRSLSASYGLEYGKDVIEVHGDACAAGERVLIADDVLATGGTAEAACGLARQLGADILGLTFFIELAALKGRDRLPDRPVHSVLVL